MDISNIFNLQNEPPEEPAQLPPLHYMSRPPKEENPDTDLRNLGMLLHLMQKGTVSQPMWFKDPDSMRAVVMLPLDITAMTPAINRQLWELMALNAKRAPRDTMVEYKKLNPMGD